MARWICGIWADRVDDWRRPDPSSQRRGLASLETAYSSRYSCSSFSCAVRGHPNKAREIIVVSVVKLTASLYQIRLNKALQLTVR
jgi:hypothetical protein